MLRKFIPLAALAAGLSGCASVPVRGQAVKTGEVFIGDAGGNLLTGTGTLRMTSNRGVTCTGTYASTVPTGDSSGTGDFACTDGRKGKLTFNSDGRNAAGFAVAENGDEIRFVAGIGAVASPQPW